MLIDKLPVEINLIILEYLSFTDLLGIYYGIEGVPEYSEAYIKNAKSNIRKIINSKWKRRDYWESWCISKVYQEGDLNMLKWALENNIIFSFSDISSVSSYCNYVHILKWLKKSHIPLNIDLVEMACIGNAPGSIEYLISIGYQFNAQDSLNLCEERGSLDASAVLRKFIDLNKN